MFQRRDPRKLVLRWAKGFYYKPLRGNGITRLERETKTSSIGPAWTNALEIPGLRYIQGRNFLVPLKRYKLIIREFAPDQEERN